MGCFITKQLFSLYVICQHIIKLSITQKILFKLKFLSQPFLLHYLLFCAVFSFSL